MPEYAHAWVAVNAVIFSISQGQLKVFLFLREKEPFKGLMELPGGLILKKETAEETLERKLHELFPSRRIFFQQFFTFTALLRDPRERAVSIGFIALINSDKASHSSSWFNVDSLPKLAFDHAEIIDVAHKHLRRNVGELIVRQFLPEKFPLNKLQEAFEIIEGKKYDNRNFRKKMLNSEIVEETSEIEKNVAHRPAKLYKFVR